MLSQVQLATRTKNKQTKKTVNMIHNTKNNNYYNNTKTKYQDHNFNLHTLYGDVQSSLPLQTERPVEAEQALKFAVKVRS